MKKIASIILLMLAPVLIFSFATTTDDESEIKITVTADKQTKFDMFQDSRIIKGLTTPYEFKVKTSEGRFIFKSAKLKSSLKVNVQRGNGGVIGEWPITVVLINGDRVSTFGMD
jgi:hypothetical protein